METLEIKKGKFTASNISRLLAEGNGKTRQNYILELAMDCIGLKKDELDTRATRHGIISQYDCFEVVRDKYIEDLIWFDEYLPINDLSGSSPDCLTKANPFEIKSPYCPNNLIDSFIEQIHSMPTKYYQQCQMQILSCKSDIGYLCFYLTRPEEEMELMGQFPFELDKRLKIFEIKKDEELHDTILKKVEESEPKKQQVIELLKNALVMDFERFFALQWEGNKLRQLKDCNNIFNLEQVIRVGDSFYYEKR